MTQPAAPPRKARLLGWIGWAGLDAIGRLVLMMGSTVVLSRMLTAHDFGVTTLVLTVVSSAAIFVGAPFEDALTQRRQLRTAHLRAALGASWLVGALLFLASIPVGQMVASAYGLEEIRYFLPVAMASIFFSGHSDILTALARRRKRFNDVAYATLVGHVIGISLSLLVAFLGYGAWALIAQRVFVVIIRAIVLQSCIGTVILPSWSPRHVRDIGRFAGLSFLSRLTENLTYLVFNNLVQVLYGVTALGHMNMAMRLIEPIRGAIVATGHNLSFSFFARAQHDPGRFRILAGQVVSQSALVIVPVFVGMAVVAPILLPLVAGPGWEEAIAITICLSIAGAIAVPAGPIYAAFSASGRPEISLISLLTGFAGIVFVLITFRSLGLISVGLSRIAGDVIRTAFAIGTPLRRLDWSRRERLRALLPSWALGLGMGLLVASAGGAIPVQNPVLHLVIQVSLGIVIYGALLMVFARSALDSLGSHVQLPGFIARPRATP